MSLYIVKKILSNNVILVEQDSQEYVFIGKGIGFGRKKEQTICYDENIEKKFFSMSREYREKYEQLFNHMSEEIIAVSEEVILLASKELQEEMNEQIHIALADHISFFVRRWKEGIDIVNPFLTELKSLYSVEYEVAKKAAVLIKNRLGLDVPDGEIGFLTLHIHSGIKNRSVSEMIKNTKLFHEIVNLIEQRADIRIDSNSINYARLVTHIRFALERLKMKQTEKNILLKNIRKQYPQEYSISKEICEIISRSLDVNIPEGEIGNITIHVYRIIESEKSKI